MKYVHLGLALLLLVSGLAFSDNLSHSITSKKVMLSLNRWANAWSDQDMERYFNSYARNFKGFENSTVDWKNKRHARIQAAKNIRLKLSDIQLRSLSDDKAIVDFIQSFKSNSFSDRVKKRLTLKYIGDQWKIIAERTLTHID